MSTIDCATRRSTSRTSIPGWRPLPDIRNPRRDGADTLLASGAVARRSPDASFGGRLFRTQTLQHSPVPPRDAERHERPVARLEARPAPARAATEWRTARRRGAVAGGDGAPTRERCRFACAAAGWLIPSNV